MFGKQIKRSTYQAVQLPSKGAWLSARSESPLTAPALSLSSFSALSFFINRGMLARLIFIPAAPSGPKKDQSQNSAHYQANRHFLEYHPQHYSEADTYHQSQFRAFTTLICHLYQVLPAGLQTTGRRPVHPPVIDGKKPGPCTQTYPFHNL